MTETTASDRSVPRSPRPSRFGIAPRYRFSLTVLVILVIAWGCYTLGRHSGTHEVADYRKVNAQLRSENSQLITDKGEQASQITSLKNQLKSVQDQLGEFFLQTRNHQINANESKLVSIGQMIIGLIGTPRNESVDLNINGKQQSAAAGFVTDVEFPTICRIEVISFDVLKSSAAVRTTCTAVKP